MVSFLTYKKIAYLSYNLIMHYVNIRKFCDVYLVQFKVKTLHGVAYDYIEFQIPVDEWVQDNAHAIFFAFFEEYIHRHPD